MRTRRELFALLLAVPLAAVVAVNPRAQCYDFVLLWVDYVDKVVWMRCVKSEDLERERVFTPDEERSLLARCWGQGWRREFA